MLFNVSTRLCREFFFVALFPLCLFIYMKGIHWHPPILCIIAITLELVFCCCLHPSALKFPEFSDVHFMFVCSVCFAKTWTTSWLWATTLNALPPRCRFTLIVTCSLTPSMPDARQRLQHLLQEGLCALEADQTRQDQLQTPPSRKLHLPTRLGVPIGQRQKC